MVAVLYAAAMSVLVLYGINLLWLSLQQARHDSLKDRNRTCPIPDKELPWVTVQIPLFNEALVARRVIDACAALDYPNLDIQVLDDSNDQTADVVADAVLHWKARGVDIVHIRRAHRTGYKAGALQNGLARARGSLIAIFDADFVPNSDFLRRLVPKFEEPGVGMVQARWGHLNAGLSMLTRLQAWALDAHFALEQAARQAAGYFVNFNGTAGVWRTRCIHEAGGWHSDTLAEDVDLSYRAQLKGWQFLFMSNVEAPAELPATLSALRAQQFRWTKGTAEAARKLLTALWRSKSLPGVKIEGTLHLTSHIVYPALVVVALLHAPLSLLEARGSGPGPVYFAILSLGLCGLLGFFLAQLFAQRALYPDWHRRIWGFPVFMAGSMALAISNSKALWQALRRRVTPFERTPKAAQHGRSPYDSQRAPLRAALEGLLAIYCLAGLVAMGLEYIWLSMAFQAVFAFAYIAMTLYNMQEWFPTRTGLHTP
ncbi:MAG: glycosyltransferase [Bacteroidota bacterium]|nr:glycosyltransferase [Bacteroidota bacterium]